MKKILGAILICIVVIALSAFFIVRSLEDRVTDEFVAQMSRLAIPGDWEQLDDIVRREQLLCFSANPCPSIARRWQADTAVTIQDLEQIGAPADVIFSVEGTCQRPATATGPTTLCIGYATKDGYKYQLTVSSELAGLQVALDVRPS